MGLFDEQLARKPNNYPWTQSYIEALWKGHWTPTDYNFNADYAQFKALTPEEQGVVARNLSAIGQIEIAVKTFWANLGANLPHPSLSDLGYVMSHSEVIHNLAYEKLLDRLQMQEIFQENLSNPIVKGRVDYLRRYAKRVYADDRKQYIYALILFTLFVENVSLFSQFYIIRWLHRFHNTEKLLRDTAHMVHYTRAEEHLHAQVGVQLIKTMRQEYPELFDNELEERIRSETAAALEAEGKVIDWIMGSYKATGVDPETKRIHTLDADVLKRYVEGRMRQSLNAIGYDCGSVERDDETHWFEKEMNLNMHVDFFEERSTAYQKRAVAAEELF